MLRILAGDLTAPQLFDGSHGARYLARGPEIAQKVCEQLILHEQVLIPTTDYLTAAGLIDILGEELVIEVLESDQLRFVRLRNQLAYTRNLNRTGGLVIVSDPEEKRPGSSPIESSIQAALREVRRPLRNREQLARLLIERSVEMELAPILTLVRDQVYADLRKSKYWHSSYANSRDGTLRLPGIEKGQVRILGPATDPVSNPVDALLALALANVELYLAKHFKCISTSTGASIGDCISIKLSKGRSSGQKSPAELWSFLEIENVPNLAIAAVEQPERLKALVKLTRSKNCDVFRQWLFEAAELTERELITRYIELLHDVPWVASAPVKAIRMAIVAGLGIGASAYGIPLVGDALGALDAFGTEQVLKGSSAKYFVDDLKNFSGRIGVRR